MVAVISSIVVALSILIAALINFGPNITHLMESDFQERANTNAFLCALQRGQLAARARTIDSDPATSVPDTMPLDFDLRSIENSTGTTLQNKIHADITLVNGRITLVLCDDKDNNNVCP